MATELDRREREALDALRAKKRGKKIKQPAEAPVVPTVIETDQSNGPDPETMLKQLITARSHLSEENGRISSDLISLKAQLESKKAAVAAETSKTTKLEQQLKKLKAVEKAKFTLPALEDLKLKLRQSKEALAKGDLATLEEKAKEREAEMRNGLEDQKTKLAGDLALLEKEKGEKSKLITLKKKNDKHAEELRRDFAIVTGELPVPSDNARLSTFQSLYKDYQASRDEVKQFVQFCNEGVEARARAEEEALQYLVDIIDNDRALVMLATLNQK